MTMEASGISVDSRQVPIDALKSGLSPRLREDHAHARVLAESFDSLPPILVHRETMTIIDGSHRRLAAQMLGLKTVPVVFFTGSDGQAQVEAVRRNITHGKPLTIDERQRGARRVIEAHPEWSDRRIAEACGLSPKRVADVRRSSANGSALVKLREGRDGRVRPADPASVRRAVADILQRNPKISLRTVADMVSTSQATVLDVRRRLQRGENPLPPRLRRDRCDAAPVPVPARPSGTQVSWREDPALKSTASGEAFVNWFRSSAIDEMVALAHVSAIPRGRLYLIADEARRRAAAWTTFANALEGQARYATTGASPGADSR